MAKNITNFIREENVLTQNNLKLCKVTYFETCWCKLNSNESVTCPYLLRHVNSSSNSSYFCVYHIIRKTIECFDSSIIYPKDDFVSNTYIYLTIILFLIGIIGNGLSIIVLFDKTLRYLSIYRNLAILCAFNIFYLLSISIRHINKYNQDLRNISPNVCRWHKFIVTFTGHLCTWQLVSTSIQRVHALLSLQLHRTTSWKQTLSILFLCIILPLFIFDGQLLFNYGLLYKKHMCDDTSPYTMKQFQRAVHLPINNNSKLLKNISIRYYTTSAQNQILKSQECGNCMLWNIFDTFIYAIIPFLIITISSLIIIIKIHQRRRLFLSLGGICHTKQRLIRAQDNLSIFLIAVNCLFLIMSGPLNIYFMIQTILKYFFSKTFSIIHLNELLRLLQNSYHALSFIFYCVIGNKFRKSTWSITQRIYYQLIKSICKHKNMELLCTMCHPRQKRPTTNGPTSSTSTSDSQKLLPSSIEMNVIRKKNYIAIVSTTKQDKK
ncbi:unnamed protein product [Adineta steineri]|uniref:G-protein coupled receptors family 1 profile domain-containing protein n=1 Tax=Adineta steineri TaxID=433720 RepID=A0A819TC95_9BILA|nr:unnamed protein product [Adineta steineri]CAF4074538.1 unnamed protein product [Adineta steineri]